MVSLTGFMATGKTEVGRILARRLGLPFVDLDQRIEREQGLSIPEIFATAGEDSFRRIESRALEMVLHDGGDESGMVLATGGGTVMLPGAIERLKERGALITLTAAPETIYRRVSRKNKRPLLRVPKPREEIERLLDERAGFYDRSHFAISTDERSAVEVAELLMQELRTRELLTGDGAPPDDRLSVELGGRSYPIVITEGGLEACAETILAEVPTEEVALISDLNVHPLYGKVVHDGLAGRGVRVVTATFAPGEEQKTLATVQQLYQVLLDAGLTRGSVVIALGGGVVGDVAGFTASTFLRGVRLVQIPTTLLAQVDSSIGGKTGVNHSLGKNLIGTFHQPGLVYCAVATLHSLPRREFAAGLPEVIKAGFIRDPELLDLLERRAGEINRRKSGILRELIRRSLEIKARVVAADEREAGLRSILNFGHTLGHAIEAAAGYRQLRHGEAVGLGMVLAARISRRLGRCGPEIEERLRRLLACFNLPHDPAPHLNSRLLDHLVQDKKRKGRQVNFIAVTAPGEVVGIPLLPEEIGGML